MLAYASVTVGSVTVVEDLGVVSSAPRTLNLSG